VSRPGALAAFAFLAACRTAPLDLAHPDPALEYVSDYFSFVGADEHGRVCFALDNNRGRDGEDYQSEHNLSLHAEHEGWIEVVGKGVLPNPTHALATIPDDEFFTFRGSAEHGLVVRSAPNALQLESAPIPRLLERRAGAAELWLGAADATLVWGGRTLRGRVIYEYLSIPGFNRITRAYSDLWRDFQGLYLRLEPAGDLYFHVQASPALAALTGAELGFLVRPDGSVELIQDLELDEVERSQALGFYRRPRSWRGHFGPDRRFHLALVDQDVISNWLIGGYAMGIAAGEVALDGTTLSAYGLAELLD
jgi:hypothetical protein